MCTVINNNNDNTMATVVKCMKTVDLMVQPCEEGPNVPWYYVIHFVSSLYLDKLVIIVNGLQAE